MADARIRPRKDFSWVSTSPTSYSRIARQYGTTAADKWGGSAPFGADNPNLGPVEAPENPNLTGPGAAAANAVQRNLNVAANTQAGNLRSASSMVPGMGSAEVETAPVPGASVPPSGFDVDPQSPAIHPLTGQPVAGSVTDNARALWLAQGGTDRTLHRAQVAQGIRPAIDGRAPHSSGELPSAASMAAMREFGDGGPGQEGHSPWVPTTFGNAGSQIWAEMSQRHADARARLIAGLQGQKMRTANVVAGGPGDATATTDLSQPTDFGGADSTA